MIKDNANDVRERLLDRYRALRNNPPTGVIVGSFNVPYAKFHEFGTKWSNRMPRGFWAAMKNRKQRSPSKNVMEFSGTGKNRMARLKARPFVRPALEQHQDRISDMIIKACSSQPESLERVFMRIGNMLTVQITRNIRNPPKPEGGARGPIANTGNLLNSIRYELKR